jgi:ATP-dependent Clp protease adapter protein ClpS
MSQFHADSPDPPSGPKPSPPAARHSPLAQCQPLALFKVVLHSDSINELMHVVRTVMELTRFPRAEATHKMWEAHHGGRSVLLQTYRERAELFVEQFANRGLNVTIEPV